MYINSVLVNTVYKDSTYFPNSVTVSHLFVPNDSFNVLCAGGDITLKNPAEYIYNFTILVDNFTLYQVQQRHILIQFHVFINEKIGEIHLNASYILPMQYANHIRDNIEMAVEDVKIQNFQIVNFSEESLSISIKVQSYLNLLRIRVSIHGFIIRDSIKYFFDTKIVFNRQKTNILPLPQQQVKVVEMAENVGYSVFNQFYSLYALVSAFTCSYFFVDFLAFKNLAIFYNFLNLKTQPQFSYLISNRLASISFENDSRLIILMKKLLNNQNVDLKDFSLFNYFLNSAQNQQKIQTQRNNYSWFHTFNITYNFINNNFVTFCFFGLLMIKFILLYGFGKIIKPWFNNNRFDHILKYRQIIIIQILCSCPIMCISVFSNLLDAGYFQWMSKVNFILHLSLFGIICMLPFMYYLTAFDLLQFRISKIPIKCKKDSKNVQNMKQLFLWNECFQFLRFSLHIIIPCVVFIGNQIGFMIISSCLIAAMIFCYIEGFYYFPHSKKITRGFMLFFLLTHHLTFLCMLIVANISQNYDCNNEYLTKLCSICGVIVIFTLILGGFIQIINTMFQFFYELIHPLLTKITVVCKKQPQISQQNKDQIPLKQNKNVKLKNCKKIEQDSAIMIHATIEDKFIKQKILAQTQRIKKIRYSPRRRFKQFGSRFVH